MIRRTPPTDELGAAMAGNDHPGQLVGRLATR